MIGDIVVAHLPVITDNGCALVSPQQPGKMEGHINFEAVNGAVWFDSNKDIKNVEHVMDTLHIIR